MGALLRDWRHRRGVSQLDLSLDTGVSTRHLSCVETGRARPSAELLLVLAERLQVPLRERNRWLLAAGHAPRYREHTVDAPALQPALAAMQRLLEAHDPYPGLLLDRHWNVVHLNRAAQGLAALLPPALREPPLNMLRASLHPQGFAAHTENFAEWGRHLVDNLQRAALQGGDPALVALEAELSALPTVRALLAGPPPADTAPLLLPCVLRLPQGRVSLISTLTTFGAPREVQLSELCAELFYPADAATEALLRQGSP